MIRSLASYRIGDRLILREDDWFDRYRVEVELLQKAPRLLKVRVKDDTWWAIGRELWLPADKYTIIAKLPSIGVLK